MAYQLLKPSGDMSAISVLNDSTGSNTIIGTLDTDIRKVLDEHVITPSESEPWRIDIDKATAVTLAQLAFKIKKPKRDQSKKYIPPKEEQKIGVNIDPFDYIFNI